MPKLSSLVGQQQASGATEGQDQQERKSAAAQHQLSPIHAVAATRLREDYEKRVATHGPRTYRWPDGTLRAEKPPPNPYAAANRQKWEHLVRHCRMHGGDRSYERNGYSLRYGIGVDHRQHQVYLHQIGLEPEVDERGQQQGWQQDGAQQNPLDDPGHCFNTFYKEAAAAVFKGRRGWLL